MSELGALLKTARQEKGLSLDDVQEQTKIRKRYLEALEEGDFKVLPGKFYIRAFIKNYAECVGLDAEEVLKHYQNEVPEPEVHVAETLPARKPKRMRSSRSERFGKIGFSLLMWLFLLLVIIVIWYYNVYSKEGKPANEPDSTPITDNSDITTTPTPTKTGASPTPTPTSTPTPPPVALTFQETKGRDDIFVVSPAKDSYELLVTNSGDASWLEVYENGKNGTKLYYANIKDGEQAAFTVKGDVYLVLGRPGNLEVKLDNVIVEDGDNNKGSKRILLQLQAADTTAQ
ncbi:helix-turn-helix domain-containing protein [Paenibacillus camelliae]|uniref:helix-turn-helix domain-containing protein n=1 Tax=Paenibacillus camelliae TaxID=512410 RepID=UPI00203E07CB|nr:helix-turn-helix domain-containing protein [Paenibacillus camelliae]